MKDTILLGNSLTELLVARDSARDIESALVNEQSSLVVISDEQVCSFWQDTCFKDFPWLTVKPGEKSKCLAQAGELWSKMVSLGLTRQSIVVAIGGGVVCDLAGFVAATYLRGVTFHSIPTSLLAMVDASVGGKVGIDLPEGKNLVGQFYPAKRVAVDVNFLATLPAQEWSAGMAEVIKHGILQGPNLWEQILSYRRQAQQDPKLLEELLCSAIAVKVKIVSEDPYETTGLRATLNLGHTFGHAIEWCSEYRLNHGESVALGLLAGLRLSRELELLEEDFERDLLALFQRWELPTSLPLKFDEKLFSWTRLTTALNRDKKNKNGAWCFVLPKQLGKVETLTGPPVEAVRKAYTNLFTQGDQT